MSRVALWRRAEIASTLLVPFLATAISFASITRADSVETSAPNAAPTPQNCQEQFLLDRRQNAQLALQRLRRCNAMYNASTGIEEFTFWYVALSSKSSTQRNAWFGNIWQHNVQILTAAPIRVPKQEAIGILDAGISRGLKRAKREDLDPKWLASHDPAVIAEAISPGVPAQTQHEHAPQSRTGIARPPQHRQADEMLARSPQIYTAPRAETYGAVSRPRSKGEELRPDGALTDELNRAQLQDRAQYASGGALYSAPPPHHIASSGQPTSSFASVTVQQPAYSSSPQQQSGFAASSPQQQATAAYLPLPLQIVANVRSLLQQFATDVSTLEQAISRQLRGY